MPLDVDALALRCGYRPPWWRALYYAVPMPGPVVDALARRLTEHHLRWYTATYEDVVTPLAGGGVIVEQYPAGTAAAVAAGLVAAARG